MNIQKASLKGFIGIKKGMGLDEIKIDLTNINGLIAFSGPTGIGKTSIIENLQPYPVLVSRPGKALKNHVFLRGSVKELSFLHDGARYETIVKIDAESGRTEGYIKVNGESVVNGKITEYNNYISNIFGSSTLFFNSVFCAQNSTKISGLKPAELKALFAEFLGDRLQKLISYEDAAKQAAAATVSKANKIEGRIFELTVGLNDNPVPALITELDNFKKLAESSSAKKEAVVAMIAKLKADREALTEVKIKNEKLLAEIEHYKKDADRIRSEMKSETDQADIKLSELRKNLNDCNTEISSLEKLLLQKDEIENAAAEKEKLESAKVSLDAVIEKARKGGDLVDVKLQDLKNDIDKKSIAISKLEAEIQRIEDDPVLSKMYNDIVRYNSQVDDLEKIGTDLSCDCGKAFSCNSKNCEYIAKAVIAKRELPEMVASAVALEKNNSAKIKELKKEKENISAEILSAQAIFKNISDEIAEWGEKEMAAAKERKAVQEKINAASALAAKMPEVQIAQFKKNELEKKKREITDMGIETKKERERKTEEANIYICGIDDMIKSAESKIDSSVGVEDVLIRTAISDAETDLKKEATRQRGALIEIQRIQTDIDAAKKTEAELEKLRKQARLITNEIAEWNYLKDACGANGLRSLEIDAVAPGIAHDANMLLEKAFGATAMVEFLTQDESGREVLEPRAIDQDGESVLIGNRSGGQQVWALKALRLAMTMISKEKSGRDFLTAYADEDDAGLDVETAQSFTRLYRAFMNIGGFAKCCYISHKQECVALADHVVEFRQGGIKMI